MKIDVENLVSISEAKFCQDEVADDQSVDEAASRILTKHIKAFEELAK